MDKNEDKLGRKPCKSPTACSCLHLTDPMSYQKSGFRRYFARAYALTAVIS